MPPAPTARGPARPQPLLPLALAGLLLAGCVPAHRRASWAIYPLQRVQPHDGLAVVSQPDGYGLHLWLETDTSQRGTCRPRWLVDPARLFNGNGTAPFSSGVASRAEFFEAVARADVRRALRRELEALCRARAPRSSWQWTEPPRSAAEVKVERFPLLEESDLLPPAAEVREQEEALLRGGGAPAGQAQP
ncbi:hypothetical protein KBZ20_07490 [Vulcanococcus limneticus Candia 3F8]|uniref:hypothetical protein n=1 Tax=Vulcanococcus limneticus TaxID=2170428 RepID=UPI000B98070B|nr:hypothetical protein [Vulcanococcus limneticus]MCP9791703.1 hypothetical protein [Vulcanococcus limneticus MW73D5]MCP9893613.1 hypothetical protein [Vulcanococcus limneticus Candia 3F8]MCP9897146.1 hypothetical protein [Vulcanococcus limneticus Candia 3B3]